MIKRLDEFVIGETGQIKKVDGEGRLRKRLFDMGVTPGTEVYLRKKAPLGDSIEITMGEQKISFEERKRLIKTINTI